MSSFTVKKATMRAGQWTVTVTKDGRQATAKGPEFLSTLRAAKAALRLAAALSAEGGR